MTRLAAAQADSQGRDVITRSVLRGNGTFFLGKTDHRTKILMAILNQYISEPAFQVLRTQEQLGYIVAMYTKSYKHVSYFTVLVQSNVKSPEYCSTRIEEFLKKYKDEIRKITDEEFQKLCKAVEVQNTKKPLNLAEETDFLWSKVNDRTYDFDMKRKLPEMIATVQKHEIIHLFDELFFQERKVVEFQIISEAHQEENDKFQAEREKTGEVALYFDRPEDFKSKVGAFHSDYIFEGLLKHVQMGK